MPLPVSVTSMMTLSSASSTESVILPLFSIASTAFLQRFSITHSMSVGFNSMNTCGKGWSSGTGCPFHWRA